MKFDELYPSRFLKATDLDKPLTLKIRDLEVQSLGGEGSEEKPVLFFVGYPKGLVLNKTNAATIANIADSDDSDDWLGIKIELYRESILMHGERKACVRVRAPRTGIGVDVPDAGDPLNG